MPAFWIHPHQVLAEDIDRQGHVNNLRYLHWMIDAAVAHSSAQGWDTDRYVQEGASWVVRSHWIEYRQPCFEGEEIEVTTWVANMVKIRSLRKYRITRKSDDALLAVAKTNWVFVGTEHQVPRRIPEPLAHAFTLVSGENEVREFGEEI